MSFWDFAGGAATAVGNYFSAKEQRKAAEAAAAERTASINKGLDFQQQNLDRSLGLQRSAYDQGLAFNQGLLGAGLAQGQEQMGTLESVYAPYLAAGNRGIDGIGAFGDAGLGALRGQQALTGLLGADEQSAAIANIANSPEMAALTQQGEDAILARASATGGLRGGNTQAALAQFRPQVLSQLINQRYSQLGGLSALGSQNFGLLGSLGQNGANGLAQGGLDVLRANLGLAGQVGGNVTSLNQTLANGLGGVSSAFGANVADLIGQQGAVNGGNAIAQGQANANVYSGIAGGINQGINQAAILQRLRSGPGLAGTPKADIIPEYSFGSYTPDAVATRVYRGGL